MPAMPVFLNELLNSARRPGACRVASGKTADHGGDPEGPRIIPSCSARRGGERGPHPCRAGGGNADLMRT
jgi:hypothetical protein